jgi:TRAP-type C4-dicarboxylate transport system permease small subunit
VGLIALVCCGLFAWGGYVAHWEWTGLSGEVKLWDWLEALALPVTFGLVPLFLAHRHPLHPRHKRVAAAVLAGFAALVLAG